MQKKQQQCEPGCPAKQKMHCLSRSGLLMSKTLMAICGERGEVSQLSLSISITLPFERKLMQLWVSYITYFSANMHLWTSLYCRPILCCFTSLLQYVIVFHVLYIIIVLCISVLKNENMWERSLTPAGGKKC